MSVEILEGQGRVNDLGQLVLPLDDENGRRIFFREFFKTEAGQKLRPYLTVAAERRIGEVAATWYGNDVELTIAQVEKAVESLLAVRDPAIFPPQSEPAPTPERPRRADGTFIGEYEQWAADPTRSMAEIRRRAQSDPEGFGAWFVSQRAVEGISEGEFHIVGGPSRPPTDADENLLGAFVRAYTTTPTTQLRPIGGFVITNDGKKYSKAAFDQLVERAANAGLI